MIWKPSSPWITIDLLVYNDEEMSKNHVNLKLYYLLRENNLVGIVIEDGSTHEGQVRAHLIIFLL